MPIFVGMVVSSLCYVVAKLELTGPDIYQQLQQLQQVVPGFDGLATIDRRLKTNRRTLALLGIWLD